MLNKKQFTFVLRYHSLTRILPTVCYLSLLYKC